MKVYPNSHPIIDTPSLLYAIKLICNYCLFLLETKRSSRILAIASSFSLER